MASPELARQLRRRARRQRDALRGQLGRHRYDALVAELGRVVCLAQEAGATATLLGLEGPLRHAIRSDLCLQGWRWIDAHLVACDMMDEVLRRVRATRPDWYEGQPEHTIEGGVLIERTRCIHCHEKLPEGHRKFCGALCRSSHHMRLARMREASEGEAAWLATRSI
ncbi:hypothetical protein [Rhodosalinus sp. K401]|uniref:hypothetical protein n=1 Tax=Rhodosalinus sp. K401 TaxID=3239195 RepID=UPI0035245E1A